MTRGILHIILDLIEINRIKLERLQLIINSRETFNNKNNQNITYWQPDIIVKYTPNYSRFKASKIFFMRFISWRYD